MSGLFLFFIVVPIVEMYLLFQVSDMIGALPTIAIVLSTALMGSWLIRKEGLSTLLRAQDKMQSGQIPMKEMAEGITIAVGGALLVTPGFVTDFFGFCCLIPGLRNPIMAFLTKRLLESGNVHISGMGGMNGMNGMGGMNDGAGDFSQPPFGDQRQPRRGVEEGDIIEGEFKRED